MGSMTKKFFVAIFALIIIITSSYTPVTYGAEVPTFVRIGLFFNYGSMKTAVDSVTISAEKGIEAGWYAGGDLNVIYSTSDNLVLKIRKDSKYYFVYSKDITNRDQAQAKANEIIAKGVNAFVAVNNTNSWVVLVGGYADKATADADKANNLDKKLPGIEIALVSPSPRMIIVENVSGQAVCGFYSDTINFTLRPSVANDLKVVKVNSKAYRGEIEVIRQTTSDMTVINIVGLEQYLYGVVPAEIGASSPTEALKAQAIAARTYVAKNMSKYSSIGFNLCTTTYSQVYSGFSAESLSSNKAVEATTGQLLMYEGKPAEVYYFSSSGGMTEDVKNVWGSTTFPYLVSVEDKYETPTTTYYTWTKTFTVDQIKSKVQKDIGDVVGMEVTKRSDAGRVTELVIKGTKDQAVYPLERARMILSLPSQWYTIETGAGSDVNVSVGTVDNATSKIPSSLKIITESGIKDAPQGSLNVIGGDGTVKNYSSGSSTGASSDFTITGKGWGHAVGMSQNGAMGMAKAGFTYKQILEHYFKGAVVQ